MRPTPFFAQRSEPPRPLRRSLSVRTLIIGAGITGLSLAYHLLAHGERAVIVEAQEIPSGATARCAGILTPSVEEDLKDTLARPHGEEILRHVRGGMEGIVALAREHRIACDIERAGSLYIATAQRDTKLLDEELRVRKERLRDDLKRLSAQETRKRVRIAHACGALYDPVTYTIDPVRFCQGLAAHLREHGVDIHTHARIVSVDMSRRTARTAHNTIRFERIVFTSGASLSLITPRQRVFYMRTHIIASEPLPKEELARVFAGREVFWSTEPVGYYYGRLTADDRIIFGGGESVVAVKMLGEREPADGAAALEREFRRLFPHASIRFAHGWSGVIEVCPDLLPLVGEVEVGAYAAIGTVGLPFGFANGRLLAQLLAGERPQNPFAFDRALPLRLQPYLLLRTRPGAWIANTPLLRRAFK